MPIPKALQDSLRAGRVVPFVGAGVSMSVLDRASRKPAFPSWRQLLEDSADRLDQENKSSEGDVVRSLVRSHRPDFLYAATRARTALGPIWYEFLKDSLDIPFERIDDDSLALARAIWGLGSNLVITTNYDEVLRWACPRQQDLQSWDIEAPVEQANLLQQPLQRPVIWHLHGRLSKASQLILSPDGYQLLYPELDGDQRKVEYQAALSTLRYQLTSRSFLFIGFSLEDEYFGMQLENVTEIYKGAVGPHYALVREADAERVRKLNIEPVTFSDFGEPLMALMAELAAISDSDRESLSKVSVIPDYGPHRSVFYVPFKQKGDEIVGQQQVLEDVRKQLTEGKRTAIGQTAAFRGLGGLGKTQLAIEYAYRYRDQYPNGVIWLTADQNIDAQLIEIAEKAGWIAPESEHKYKIEIAQQRIRSYSDCLIIFDNLEDRRAIDSYLPEPEANPHILVTSRGDHADFYPVALELLDRKFSSELLIKEARRDPETEQEEKAVEGIITLLGGLPLALELAGAYLAHRRTVRFQQYYDLLFKDLKSALPKSVSSFTKHEADLYSTLRLSEDLLQEEQQLRDVLDLLTWSGSAPMSSDLMSDLLGTLSDGTLASALALGAELRLLQPSKEQDRYSLHRLVGEVRRTEIPLEQRLDWVDTVCSRIGNWFQEKKEDFSQLNLFESELDHLKKWQENAARFATSHSSRLMWLQAYPAYHRGRYVEARDYVVEAQRLFDQLSDTNRELQAHLLTDLAGITHGLGESRTGLTNLIRALTIRRELFGERHRDIAASLNAISILYGDQGDLQQALDYSEQALKMRRELFGEPHRDIAISLANIGRCYDKQGDPQKALEYSEQALAMQCELFGERHPDIAILLDNVGGFYGDQGDLERALDYSEQALRMRRELFGERHPHIATSLANIGGWHRRQGDLQRAVEYSEQALAMQRELFGERHRDIASSLENLSLCYGEQGGLQRALDYSQQAFTMRLELFGEKHPTIANSLINLGALCGDISAALDYYRQALRMYRELFGERHPSTIDAASRVAVTLAQLNRRKEAYDVVSHFVVLAQGPLREMLKHLETQLLSKPIPGFRPQSKTGKRKGKKKRR